MKLWLVEMCDGRRLLVEGEDCEDALGAVWMMPGHEDRGEVAAVGEVVEVGDGPSPWKERRTVDIVSLDGEKGAAHG